MGVNSLDQVIQNIIAMIVVAIVFFWVYKNMQDTAIKKWIGEMATKIKEAIKGDE